MKKLYIFWCFVAASWGLSAQQEVMHTQFMFNRLLYNPASAGTFESGELTALVRNQWIGIEDAPNVQFISYSQPILNNRVGIGGNISRAQFGITRIITFDIAYAYRIAFRRGYLCVGLQPSIRSFYQDWASDKVRPLQALDGAIPTTSGSRIIANVGTGIFYDAPHKWFAGIALPRLIQNNIDVADGVGETSRELRHLNVIGGYKYRVSRDLQLQPQILLKFVANAPLDIDLNCNALLRSKYLGGLTYRTGGDERGTGESLDVILGLQATEKLFVALSYDIGLSRLASYSKGSIELTGRWWFNPPAPETTSNNPIPF
jgi:type IX secretion system PorP/SprF family membrane protein